MHTDIKLKKTKKVTDEALVKLFLQTKRNVYYGELYRRHADRVLRHCFSILNDSGKAEDLTHDIFLKLMFKLESFKNEARFTTWLFRITHNQCMDYLNASKKFGQVPMEDHPQITNYADVSWIFEDGDSDIKSLTLAMENLSVEERGLLFMKYVDELSISDIADIFKITNGAVKMRLLRSKEKLRGYLLERRFAQSA